MKIKQPEKEIEVCDLCQYEGVLRTCIVCGHEYCYTCECIIGGCWVRPTVCRICGNRDDVEKVVRAFADQITPIIAARTEALKALPKEAP